MAFNIIEYLRDGKVDFVYNLTSYDYNHLISLVRKQTNRIEIINGFLPKLRENLPNFCFDIIYDIPEFADEAYKLLNVKNVTAEMLGNMLNNSPLGIKILYENFDIFFKDLKYFEYVTKYAFDSNNRELIHRLSRYSDLHIRYLFMDYLIRNYPDQIDVIYDDITKYTTSITYEPYEQLTFLPQLMNSLDISKLAVLLLVNKREQDYEKLKDFILKNYKNNYLASELLEHKYIIDPNPHSLLINHDQKHKENTFDKDANTLFMTSADYRYAIYLRHSVKVKEELINDFANRIRYYLKEEKDYNLDNIYSYSLGQLLEDWTEKYMDLSENKDYGFVGKGTTCSCYRIGDYVMKLVKTKWSYENEICPNLYLIAKNYEEVYLRDNKGIITAGLEVQKYLIRKANGIDSKYFRYFDLALERLGYMRTDTLTNGTCGENTMLLDTYRDADCPNPEKVPAWFRQYPLVLIDRDRIYPKDKTYIKQLRSGY